MLSRKEDACITPARTRQEATTNRLCWLTRLVIDSACSIYLLLCQYSKASTIKSLEFLGCSRLKKLLLLYVMLCARSHNPAAYLKPSKKRRRWWVRPIFADHDQCGAWATLIPKLRETDEDMYFNFMRMTPAAFDKLLGKVSPLMTKVSWRKSIPPGERLAITLGYNLG